MLVDGSEADDPRLPGVADLMAFRERGTWVSGQIVPHALLDEVRDLVAVHQHRPARGRLPAEVGHIDWAPADGAGLRSSEFISILLPAARRLTLLPVVGQIAAMFMGTDRVRLLEDQAIEKPAGDQDAVVGWHTDSAYATTCTSADLITAWIPFDDVTAENGALLAYPGSHRWPGTQDLRSFQQRDLARRPTPIGIETAEEPVVVDVRKGAVEFHHGRLVHASGPNVTARSRLAIAVTFQGPDNRYREVIGRDGRPVVLPVNQLCRRDAEGRPDYGDDEVFPLVWRRRSTTRAT